MGVLFLGSQKVMPVYAAANEAPIGSTLKCPDYTSYTMLAKNQVHKIYWPSWLLSPVGNAARNNNSTGTMLSDAALQTMVPLSGNSFVYLSSGGSNSKLYGVSNTIAYAPDFTDKSSLAVGQATTLANDCWVSTSGALRLTDASGDLLLGGGTMCWLPFEAGTTIYPVDGEDATIWGMSNTSLATPNYSRYTSDPSGYTTTVPETCYLCSQGVVRLNASNGIRILTVGRAYVPAVAGTIIWPAGADVSYYKCAEEIS